MSAKEVWKFTLQHAEYTFLWPAGAKILHVHEQDGCACVWVEVDPSAPREARRFRTYVTGAPITRPDSTYVGTAHLHGGSFVLHVYEEPQ
jgi:hypothetical protein